MYIYVSPSVQKLRGYSAEESLELSLDPIFTPSSLLTINKIILVAEVEGLTFLLISSYLSKANFIVLQAENGLEVVDLCKTNKQIDLVQMDIKKSVMDGCEATKQIREFLPDLPRIAQTAYITDIDKNKAFENGCNDFIYNPFTKELLISKIYEHLHLT